jgi:hypothetical protein
MRKLVLVLRNNKISKLMTSLNTCMVENSNRRRLKYTPKTHFFQASYKARSLISAAVENASKLETARWLANTPGFDLDLETVKLFGDMDNRARRHRQRKTSFEYTARKKRILPSAPPGAIKKIIVSIINNFSGKERYLRKSLAPHPHIVRQLCRSLQEQPNECEKRQQRAEQVSLSLAHSNAPKFVPTWSCLVVADCRLSADHRALNASKRSLSRWSTNSLTT